MTKLPRANEPGNYVIDGAMWNRLCDAVELGANLVVKGPGVRQLDGRTNRVVSVGEALGGSSFTPIYARITDATQDGTNKRWVYEFVEIDKTAIGYDGWEDVEDGLEGECLNLYEDQNGPTGLWGNGVNSANLAGTSLTLQPVPDGTRVMLFAKTFTVDDAPVTEYWFSYNSGVDGSC